MVGGLVLTDVFDLIRPDLTGDDWLRLCPGRVAGEPCGVGCPRPASGECPGRRKDLTAAERQELLVKAAASLHDALLRDLQDIPAVLDHAEALGEALMGAVRAARATLPPMKPRGRGRPRKEAEAILVPDVERAMQACGLDARWWHNRGYSSPAFDVLAVAVAAVTGAEVSTKTDRRRLTDAGRRWLVETELHEPPSIPQDFETP